MPMASDTLSPAAAHKSRNSVEAGRRLTGAADSPGVPAQQGAGRDPHRQPVGVVGGQLVGDPAGPSQFVRPRRCRGRSTSAPARMCQP